MLKIEQISKYLQKTNAIPIVELIAMFFLESSPSPSVLSPSICGPMTICESAITPIMRAAIITVMVVNSMMLLQDKGSRKNFCTIPPFCSIFEFLMPFL